MSEEFILGLLEQAPYAAILLVAMGFFARYLSKWLSAFAAASELAAEKRQKELMVAQERLAGTIATTEKALTEVIERNTRALDRQADSSKVVAEALARVSQVLADQNTQLQLLSQTMMDHERDISARPCIASKPPRRASRNLDGKQG